jgi:hypothetical protein
MSEKNGAMVGGVIAFLFYMFLTSITPLDGKSVIPTANAVSDPVAKALYVNGLPTAMIVFISLEVVGMILGVIGYKILSESTAPPAPMRQPVQRTLVKK